MLLVTIRWSKAGQKLPKRWTNLRGPRGDALAASWGKKSWTKATQKVDKILGSPQSYEVDLWGEKRWTRTRLRRHFKFAPQASPFGQNANFKMMGWEADVWGEKVGQ